MDANEVRKKELEARLNMSLMMAKMKGDFPNPKDAFYGRPLEVWNGRTWVPNK